MVVVSGIIELEATQAAAEPQASESVVHGLLSSWEAIGIYVGVDRAEGGTRRARSVREPPASLSVCMILLGSWRPTL